MNKHQKLPLFDSDLIRRYDYSGPRYTSYPTANLFHPEIGADDYVNWVDASNSDIVPVPLSLYVHIPFCDTVCYYCGCNKVVTKNHNRASDYITHVVKELEMHAAHYDRDRCLQQIHWGGGTPTFLNQNEMEHLMAATRAAFNLSDNDTGEHSIELDPRSVNSNDIKFLRELGFNRASLGVQDFDPAVQKAVNREQSETETLEIIEAARAEGFRSINIDLIYGLPLQSRGGFKKTIERIIKADPDRIAIYNYAHLPERFPPQRRINADDLPSADEKLQILGDAIEGLTSAGYEYIGMDHFAKPQDELSIAKSEGHLHRSFQGYSTHSEYDLIAAGVSGIGKVCRNYYQNASKLDDYYFMLNNGVLPIVKGYELEPDDELRRQVIDAIMCEGVVDIRAFEKRWPISFWSYFKAEKKMLKPMCEDGLCALNRGYLTVLQPGQFLIRQIAMVFDHYLQSDQTSPRFSRAI